MIAGLVIGGIVVTMYFSVYKYEEISQSDDESEHYNHLEKMWVAFPEHKSLVK